MTLCDVIFDLLVSFDDINEQLHLHSADRTVVVAAHDARNESVI